MTIGAKPASPKCVSAMRRPSRDGTGSALPASAAETTVACEPFLGSNETIAPSGLRYINTPLAATPKGGGTLFWVPAYTARPAAISAATNASTSTGLQGKDRIESGR